MITRQSACSAIHRIAFVSVAIALSGCVESLQQRCAIKGTVKINGQPINDATLILTPIGEGLAAAATIQDGSFELSADVGPSAGDFNVRINPNEAEVEGFAPSKHPHNANARPRIPRLFQRNGSLIVQVTGERDQTLDFDLSSK